MLIVCQNELDGGDFPELVILVLVYIILVIIILVMIILVIIILVLVIIMPGRPAFDVVLRGSGQAQGGHGLDALGLDAIG